MNDRDFEYAERRVATAAMGLIITASLSGAILLLCLAFDAFLLLSGVADQMRRPAPVSKETQILVRMTWSLLILASNLVTAVGAFKMRRLESFGLARTACILAVIPCIGPCFVFGIPFGIMGIQALQDGTVKRAFAS